MKYCPNCKTYKDLNAFFPSNRSKDKLTSWCKECKIIPIASDSIKGLPLYKKHDHWEIYAKTKTRTGIDGTKYDEPCNTFLIRLKVDDGNWIEVIGDRLY